MKTIASLMLTALFAVNPATNPVGRIPSPIESSARELLTNITAGRFELAEKDFNDQLRSAVPPASLADLRRQVDGEVGAFRAVKEVRQRREDGFRVVEVIAKYEKSDVALRVFFDPYDRIGAVYMDPVVPPKVEPQLEAIARDFFTHFVAGDFVDASRHFDPGMHAQLTPEGLGQLSARVTSSFGHPGAVTNVQQRFVQGLRIIDLTAAYQEAPVMVNVVFNMEGKVTGVRLGPADKPEK